LIVTIGVKIQTDPLVQREVLSSCNAGPSVI
jgi:hypothetical protein